jgi:hypothetical protein
MAEDAATPGRTCPWCGATADSSATHCSGCGAALAGRESIGDIRIPGVTAVDPALAAYDAQPWRIPKGSPSQGMAAGTVLGAAAVGGPAGLIALAGLGAVAATEYLAAGGGDHAEQVRLEDVGRPIEPALRVAEELDRAEMAERGRSGKVGAELDPPRDTGTDTRAEEPPRD